MQHIQNILIRSPVFQTVEKVSIISKIYVKHHVQVSVNYYI